MSRYMGRKMSEVERHSGIQRVRDDRYTREKKKQRCTGIYEETLESMWKERYPGINEKRCGDMEKQREMS